MADPIYKCNICKDFGSVHPRLPNGKPDYSMVVLCACRVEQLKQERMERILRLCELPYGSVKLTLDSFKTYNDSSLKDAYKCACELAEESGKLKWLTLMSDVDRGKTHLAIAICRKWLERSKPARYVYVPTMLDELRRGYNREGDESFDSQMEFLMTVSLLVLDDLGAQSSTPWAVEKLETIIDYRYINGLPLVVTCNMPVDDFSFRIASRLRRFEAGKIIVIDAQEFRTRSKDVQVV